MSLPAHKPTIDHVAFRLCGESQDIGDYQHNRTQNVSQLLSHSITTDTSTTITMRETVSDMNDVTDMIDTSEEAKLHEDSKQSANVPSNPLPSQSNKLTQEQSTDALILYYFTGMTDVTLQFDDKKPNKQSQRGVDIFSRDNAEIPQNQSLLGINEYSYIKSDEISKPSGDTASIDFENELKSLVFRENLFVDTNWESVNKHHGFGLEYESPPQNVEIDKITWIKECENAMTDGSLPLIPIIANVDDNRGIEYIKIIKLHLSNTLYVGVGIKYHVTKDLLYGFCTRASGNESICDDVLGLIGNFCGILRVSSIYLDPDYISYHQQLTQSERRGISGLDMQQFSPFIQSLTISPKSKQNKCLELQEGELLSVPSDWSDVNL